MSKFELQKKACQAGGVSYEESLQATDRMVPSMFERIGKEEGCLELSRLFYERVFDDTKTVWFLNIFSISTKQEAIDNQFRFLTQTFGGPDLYKQKKGKYTRLVGRHANYPMSHRAADRWNYHMQLAIDEHSHLKEDPEARKALHAYFQYTAHYIVVASDYMRNDQLSGGTKIDAGRVW